MNVIILSEEGECEARKKGRKEESLDSLRPSHCLPFVLIACAQPHGGTHQRRGLEGRNGSLGGHGCSGGGSGGSVGSHSGWFRKSEAEVALAEIYDAPKVSQSPRPDATLRGNVEVDIECHIGNSENVRMGRHRCHARVGIVAAAGRWPLQ